MTVGRSGDQIISQKSLLTNHFVYFSDETMLCYRHVGAIQKIRGSAIQHDIPRYV